MSESMGVVSRRGRAAAWGLAVALVALAWLVLRDAGPVEARTIEGWAMPNAAGTAISLHESPQGGPGEGYIVAGAWWRGAVDSWHDGSTIPTCIGTDTTSFTHVRLGVVSVTVPEGPTADEVVWLHCLT